MSENITHTGIIDDTRRMVLAAAEHDAGLLPPVFSECMRECHDIMRLGGVTRHADRHSVALLADMRGRDLDIVDKSRLAFIFGWLSHRAADRQMKPVFRETCPDAPEKPTECSIYDDAFIYLRRYSAQDPLYTDALFEQMASGTAAGQDCAELRSLIRGLLQGSLIGIHTLIPDDGDGKGWIDRLVSVHQKWRINMDRYLKAITEPDPILYKTYIVETNFYDPADSLIAYVEALQAEKADVNHKLLRFAGEQSSDYAQALSKAWDYIKAAGLFFQGELDEDALADAFDHGRKGRDGLGV